MASPTFNHAVLGETLLPGQIFVFGGFALRANLLSHLEQIDSYAPGHKVRFGNLNYTADIRGDLTFNGFGPVSGAPNNHDMHDLDLQSDSIRNIARATAPDFVLEQVMPSEDGWMDPAPKAACSLTLDPNTNSSPQEICTSGPPDSSPVVCSGPRASVPIESNWALVMEFAAADIFQHSPFGDVLNSLRSLSLLGDSWPNHVRF